MRRRPLGLDLAPQSIVPVLAAFALVAFLFGAVGHGGATGYLAIAALASWPLDSVRTVALFLNILVAGQGWYQFSRAGYFRWSLLGPLIIASMPAAYLGGRMRLSTESFSIILGSCLLLAALRFAFLRRSLEPRPVRSVLVQRLGLLSVGAGLGYLAGLTGIGGGVFLSPVLMLLGWANPKQTAAASAAFIVLNSASGLASAASGNAPVLLWLYAGAVVAVFGGLGARYGATGLSSSAIQRALGLVLFLASAKLLLM